MVGEENNGRLVMLGESRSEQGAALKKQKKSLLFQPKHLL